MVSQLSAIEVADLLRKENSISERGISLIVENEIDGQALALLLLEKDEDLKAIGLAIGDRQRLGEFILKHRTKSVTPDTVMQQHEVNYNYYCARGALRATPTN